MKPLFFCTSAGPNTEIFVPQVFFVNSKGMIFESAQLSLPNVCSIILQQILLKRVISCLLSVILPLRLTSIYQKEIFIPFPVNAWHLLWGYDMIQLTAAPWMSVYLHDTLFPILGRECWNTRLRASPLCAQQDAGKRRAPCIARRSVKAKQLYEALVYMIRVLQIL